MVLFYKAGGDLTPAEVATRNDQLRPRDEQDFVALLPTLTEEQLLAPGADRKAAAPASVAAPPRLLTSARRLAARVYTGAAGVQTLTTLVRRSLFMRVSLVFRDGMR